MAKISRLRLQSGGVFGYKLQDLQNHHFFFIVFVLVAVLVISFFMIQSLKKLNTHRHHSNQGMAPPTRMPPGSGNGSY
jgi:hypothetical protein